MSNLMYHYPIKFYCNSKMNNSKSQKTQKSHKLSFVSKNVMEQNMFQIQFPFRNVSSNFMYLQLISSNHSLNYFRKTHFFRIHFFIQFTVYAIFDFFEILSYSFLNCNKTLLDSDTLNLTPHYRKEIEYCIFFIRDTFFIWLTVYEILRVFWVLSKYFRKITQHPKTLNIS